VKRLVDQDFYHQHIYKHPWGRQLRPYPATIQQAKEFVKICQVQTVKSGVVTSVPVATLSR
jgi:hypothetical protein